MGTSVLIQFRSSLSQERENKRMAPQSTRVIQRSLFFLLFLHEVASSNLIYGQEADQLCKDYKKTCPRDKVCAVQTLMWPTAIRFPVCTYLRMEPVRSRACTQAPSPGGCGGQLRRWFYNVHMGACAWFTYGGCGANSNNFLSREDCENACVKGYSITTTTTTSTFLVKDAEESGVVGKPLPDGRKYVGLESGVSWRDPEPPNSGRHGDERDRGHLRADNGDAGLSSHNQQTHFSGTKSQKDLVQHVPYRLNTLEMRYDRPDEVRFSVNGRYIQSKDHLKERSYEARVHASGYQTTAASIVTSPPTIFIKDRVKHIPHPSRLASLSLDSRTRVREPNVLLARASASDVTSGGVREPLTSSYAAGAVETVRHVPVTLDQTATRETGGEDRKRRPKNKSKKHRRRGRNRQGRQRKPASGLHTVAKSEHLAATDRDPHKPQTTQFHNSHAPSLHHRGGAPARLAEFQRGQTEYWEGSIQHRQDFGHEALQGKLHRNRHNRGKKRRMKGGHRGEKKASSEESGEVTGKKYYDTIKLFRFLEKPHGTTMRPSQ